MKDNASTTPTAPLTQASPSDIPLGGSSQGCWALEADLYHAEAKQGHE